MFVSVCVIKRDGERKDTNGQAGQNICVCVCVKETVCMCSVYVCVCVCVCKATVPSERI